MDIYAVGREIGQLTSRVTKLERRMSAWKLLWRRAGLLLLLWTAVLIAGTNVDTASDIAAAIIRKLIS